MFIVYFLAFLPPKKIQKIRIQNLKNTKYKKIQTQNLENAKYKKKPQNLQNTKYKKYKFNIRKKGANSMFILERNNQIAKKMQNHNVVFSTPCNSDFVFLGCIFWYFLCTFKSGQKMTEDPPVADADYSKFIHHAGVSASAPPTPQPWPSRRVRGWLYGIHPIEMHRQVLPGPGQASW